MNTKTTNPLRPVAALLVSVLERKLGAAYAESKANRLAGEPDGAVIFWASYELDADNKQAFCEALGMTTQELETAGKVLKLAYNL